MMKRISAILLALVLVFSVALLPAAAEGEADASYQVVLDDGANLLSAAEKDQLNATLYDVSANCSCNVLFVTADDLTGASFPHDNNADDYAKCYYNYTCGVNTDGVIVFLVLHDEIGSRSIGIFGTGKCEKRLSGDESESIRQDAIENHNPDSKGYYEFFDAIAKDLNKAIPPHLKWYMFPLAFLIAFAVAMIILLIFKGQLKSVKMEHGASNYTRMGSMHVTASRDTYLYSTVSRTARPKNNSSSSSSSSSGGSFSGGSSRF